MKTSRLLATWAILAAAMVANGATRELWLKTFLTAPVADTLSALSGIVLIIVITRLMFRIPADTPRTALLRMSAILVALTVAFEVVVGIAEGKSWSVIFHEYAIWRGRLWLLVLAVLAATPFIHRRRSSP